MYRKFSEKTGFRAQIMFLVLLLCAAVACVGCGKAKDEVSGDVPTVICTLFPQYDFARFIAGDTANVVMLLSPGVEAHMYDPTPSDMKQISDSELFIYTGDSMEGWAAQIVESLDASTAVLDLSQYVTLCEEEDHHDHEGHEHHDHGGYDPHYWLDMGNAQAMVYAVRDALCALLPQYEQQYVQAADDYVRQLNELDQAFFETVENCREAKIAFGGRFAYSYFLNRYGISYETVYHSCSAESDPSVSDVIRVIDYVNENHIPVIFYEELASGNVARTIAGDTGIMTAVFTTGHNVTKDEFESGITFIDLMEQNLSVLKEALER